MPTGCTHLDQINPQVQPASADCEDCQRLGQRPVALRMCRTCGHIGCCDSTPGQHATEHFQESGHALMSSYEPGQDWWWCYLDKATLSVPEQPVFDHP